MRALHSSLGLLGTLTWVGLPAPAGAQPVGAEFQINTYTTNDQALDSAHSIAADAGGNFVVVWESNGQDGSGTGIFAQRFNAGGQRLGVEFRVNSRTAGGQNLPAVAAAADGSFVVVWSDEDGASVGVFGQRYDRAGAPAGDRFRVNSYTTNHQTLPDVSADPAGNFVVVWASNEQDGDFYGIFGQRYSSDGARLGGEFRVNSFTDSSQWFPSVASDSSGNFVVVWESYNQVGFSVDVFGQRYDSEGQRLGAEFRVNTTTRDYHKLPAVASDPLGNFVVVWSQTVLYAGTYRILGQRYDSAGVPLGGEFAVQASDAPPTLGQRSSVASDASGAFVVAWYGQRDGSQFDIFGRRYDRAGVPRERFQINAYTTDFQGVTSVAPTGPGQFVVAWESDGQDGNEYGVFGRRLEVTGHALAVGSAPRDVRGPAGRRGEGHRSHSQSSASAANK
jgi:hypothetical protein